MVVHTVRSKEKGQVAKNTPSREGRCGVPHFHSQIFGFTNYCCVQRASVRRSDPRGSNESRILKDVYFGCRGLCSCTSAAPGDFLLKHSNVALTHPSWPPAPMIPISGPPTAILLDFLSIPVICLNMGGRNPATNRHCEQINL